MNFKKMSKWITFTLVIVFGCILSTQNVHAKFSSIEKSGQGNNSYTFKLSEKTKVKINISVDEMKKSDDIFNDDEDVYDFMYDDNYIFFSLCDSNNYDCIRELVIEGGKTKSKTLTLEAGTYNIDIWAEPEDLTYNFEINDISTYSSEISITKELTMLARDSKTLKVKKDEKGSLLGKVTWSSSNKKIATVDSNGNVKGIKAGTCTISAKTKYSNIVKCKVTVKARPQLYIKDASFDINFVGGVEPNITLENNFGKTIKYVYFECYFYNAVGDPAYCEIKKTYHQTLRIIGPIKNGGASVTCYWNPAIYNSSTSKMYIKTAKIIFKDGTSKTLSIKKSFK